MGLVLKPLLRGKKILVKLVVVKRKGGEKNDVKKSCFIYLFIFLLKLKSHVLLLL